jgi:hypothetical protein
MHVAFVLKTGPEYSPQLVDRLARQVKTHLPGASFLCLSDVTTSLPTRLLERAWPKWWSKMELFAPDIKGDLLYFDLDTTITGNLDEIAQTRELTVLSDFYFPRRAGSGMMFLPEAVRVPVWQAFTARPDHWMAHYSQDRPEAHWGDQAFLRDHGFDQAARWQHIHPGQIVSYRVAKLDVQPIPPNARVVCFHGQTKPWSAGVPDHLR